MAFSFKALPEELKPREKMKHYGQKALGNDELLAILLQSGTKDKNVLELAREILTLSNGLAGLSNMTLTGLQKINGMGFGKASIIMSVLELSRRLNTQKNTFNEVIDSPKKASEVFLSLLPFDEQESFMSLYLDKKGHMLFAEEIYRGTSSYVLASPKEVFRRALNHRAHSVIISHSHPSNHVMPSDDDRHISERYFQVGALLDIEVLDHIIIAPNGAYYSFKENEA